MKIAQTSTTKSLISLGGLKIKPFLTIIQLLQAFDLYN